MATFIPTARDPAARAGSGGLGEPAVRADAAVRVESRGPADLAQPADPAEPPASFEEYVSARGAGLVRFTTLLTGDVHRAEDLVQEALAKAYLRWGRIRRSDNPDVYLRRLLINASRRWWRRRSSGEMPVDRSPERPAPGDLSAETAERDEIRRLIARLPHRQRAVLVLRYFEDLDDPTIAEILGCGTGTVRTHAMRALHRLRGHLATEPTAESSAGLATESHTGLVTELTADPDGRPRRRLGKGRR